MSINCRIGNHSDKGNNAHCILTQRTLIMRLLKQLKDEFKNHYACRVINPKKQEHVHSCNACAWKFIT